MAVDLSTEEKLRDACKAGIDTYRLQIDHEDWLSRLTANLQHVRDASQAEFLTEAFQRDLWESDTVSATGMGRVDVTAVIQDSAVAQRLWELKSAPLPDDPTLRSKHLITAWEEVDALIEPMVNRTPRLKMYRVFAALHPNEFTTVAHLHKLRLLARTMGVGKNVDHPLVLHRRVLDRLEQVLGSAGPALSRGQLERMTLPWVLYVTNVQDQGEEATLIAGPKPGDELLKPLPADRRRRGMLAIAGLLPTVLAMIEFAKDGCKREDFREHIKSINPKLAPGSIGTNLNALIAEWGVLRAHGDDLALTSRGEALLETGEPEEVADWLLTRILGFDNALHLLQAAPRTTKELIAELQKVNPGWTSNFAPTAMINWVRGMGLAEFDSDKTLHLTDRGRDWTSRIHWVPGVLAAESKADLPVKAKEKGPTSEQAVTRPALDRIIKSFPLGVKFSDALIGHLDAGLWTHHRRHFAVLTGLSGAGKTLLARSYALGLWVDEPDAKQGLLTVPVQPGWHDPSCLLGYVNPLDTQTYVRTGFLDFLLQASGDPDRPYTVLLDEMNLSHPEQYLAPLLSAMETGDDVELHALGDEIGGVPARIPYPENLLLIGTVNMDETTHGLSDKVLDRASVIEFWDIKVDDFPGWSTSELVPEQLAAVRGTLHQLMEVLRPIRLHFGWRTIGDIIGYVKAAGAGGVIEFQTSLDNAIYAKVLPKLRGEDTPRLQKAFSDVRLVLKAAELPQSVAKLDELIDDLRHLGSARFWR